MLRTSLPILLLFCLLTATQAGCGGADAIDAECEDGVDNDHDGYVDQLDPSCIAGNNDEDNDPVTNCNDGEDDDGDGLIDYPDDPGCESPVDDSELDNPTPQCNDGEDNDDDGKTDYPDDPGCFSSLQDSETDDCPDGPNCPECANGVDDDDDDKIDFPEDTACSAASDDQEAAADATSCAGNTFEQLPQDGLVYATIGTGNQALLSSTTCGGAGSEKIYEVYVPDPTVMVATTNLAGTVINTVMYVRRNCSDVGTEVTCNDNADSEVEGSTITAVLQPGYYYIVVDTTSTTELGAFQMKVDFFAGVGEACDPLDPDACAPTLVCRTVPGNDGPTCEAPVCSDGRDDDEDGVTDYPLDPGCTSAGDATEDDDCPDGPGCPQCSNGEDDDLDGMTDYPADTGCHAASQLIEGCGDEQDPIGQVSMFTTPVDTSGASNDQAPPSGCSFGSGGPDVLYMFELPQPVTSLTVDTNGNFLDTVLYMQTAACDGTFLGCDDDGGEGFSSIFTITDVPAGNYAIVVDSYCESCVGQTPLHVVGTVPGNAPCTDPLFGAGVLTCETGAICNGSICVPPLCNNGVDDDSDGTTDFPNDPGCTDVLDNDEADTCPGTGCPVCANDADDDSDGLIDFPDDFNCVSASDGTEGCETDPTTLVSIPIHTGTTVGATSDFAPVCGFGTNLSPDKTFLLQLPALATSLQIDTVGSTFDTVISLKSPACTPEDLFCDDDNGGIGGSSRLNLSNVAAGNYVIVVDGYNGLSGNFALKTSGIVAPGSACTSPLFGAGVLACTPGQSCVSGVCQ